MNGGRRSLPPPRGPGSPTYAELPPLDLPSARRLSGDLHYPTHGYPPKIGEDRAMLSAWGRLSMGQSIGNHVAFAYQANGPTVQRALQTLLQVNGDDADAQQLTITLQTPGVARVPFSQPLASHPETQKAFQDNLEGAGVGNFPGTGAPIIWPPIYADIRWGTGGRQARALVDFVNGMEVSVSASFVKVDALIVSGEALDIAGTSAVYEVSAFVSPGIARPWSAQKTDYLGIVSDGAETARFPIPRFARSANVISGDSSATPAVTAGTLRFWQSESGANNVANYVFGGGQPLFFEVPAGAEYASVISAMGEGVSARMAIVYKLSIS